MHTQATIYIYIMLCVEYFALRDHWICSSIRHCRHKAIGSTYFCCLRTWVCFLITDYNKIEKNDDNNGRPIQAKQKHCKQTKIDCIIHMK